MNCAARESLFAERNKRLTKEKLVAKRERQRKGGNDGGGGGG